MKNFHRKNLLFSLCGLNCGLCPMKLGAYCPGCGGGEGNQACAIARCSKEYGGVEYCFQCAAYPCDRYREDDAFDSFISHRNRGKDFERVINGGIDAYNAEQAGKIAILQDLLAYYNDGHRKSFFCTAVNLLQLRDVQAVMRQIEAEAGALALKEKAALAAARFQEMADKRAVELKLRKKPGKGK